MANVLKIKRGTAAGLPGSPANDGEPHWTTDTFRLYIAQGGAQKLVGEADFVKLGGSTMTGALTLSADPTNDLHAATKQYVDGLAQGIRAKGSVKAATTANITLSGAQTIDGISLVATDRCLVKNQNTASQNGIYIVAAGAWTRATDMSIWAEVPGAFAWVEQGTANADTGWLCTSDQGGTIGSTSITFVQFSGAGQITAGTGMTKTGNTLDVVGTADRITANADSIDIASTYAGQNTIVTLGSVTTGQWHATAIAADHGGTGQTSYAVGDLLYASSSSALSKLADVATGNVLISGGVGAAPSWNKVGLTTHISGTLGAANGGTGVANNAANTITFSGNYGLTLTLSNTTSLTLPTSGTLATTSQLHTQNTDTGTTNSTFQIKSGSTGPRLRYYSSELLGIRNGADNDYGGLAAKGVSVTTSITIGDGGATNYTELTSLATVAGRAVVFPDAAGTVILDTSTVDGGTW